MSGYFGDLSETQDAALRTVSDKIKSQTGTGKLALGRKSTSDVWILYTWGDVESRSL